MDLESAEFWCELVINGIGGRTIEEAKQKISHEEFKIWWAYRKKYGSLFFGRRIEQGIGYLYGLYRNGKVEEGDRVDPHIFMPHEDQPKEEVLSVDDAMEKGLMKLT